MATRSTSIMALVNQIRNDELVLPDLQRDFVWKEDQVRLLFDSIMRGYPFGSLLFWNTQFVTVPYREFVRDARPSQTFSTKTKDAGRRLMMALDGQQRLQSLYLAIYGSYDGRRLYFNVTSGPEGTTATQDDKTGKNYRFEFWRDDEPNRAKRLLRVADVAGWAPRHEEEELEEAIKKMDLDAAETSLARRNLHLLRRVLVQSDLVPLETIDEEVMRPEQARSIDEILDIFVRVNSGGTRLTKSDLMFSLIKTRWEGARDAFDTLLARVNPNGALPIDKDFVLRGLLTVADKPPTIEVETIARHWPDMEAKFETFEHAFASAIDFCGEPDVGLRSAALLTPVATLQPIIYYLSRRPRASVPDSERKPLKAFLYFMLFNDFVSSDARIRWLREVLATAASDVLPLEALLGVVTSRQRETATQTTAQMLNWNPRLALNIAQPGVARETLSWQSTPEIDHIFPQSIYRPKHGALVDDIGNFAYLGKLRNIRKSNQLPADYLGKLSDAELRDEFLIDDRALLAAERFEDFVAARRERVVARVRDFLGR